MKKNLTVFTVTLLVIFIGFLTPISAQWPKYIIDEEVGTTINSDVADLDGDTKPDIIITNTRFGPLVWYQNNFPYWIKHTIDDKSAVFAWSGDINGNGRMDVVACLYFQNQLVWYENNYPSWTQHMIDDSTDNADFIVVKDMDNDNDPDVVAAGVHSFGGALVWYENRHPDDWIKHIIEPGAGRYASLNVSDIDEDGMLDITTTLQTSFVVWFKNENNGESWTKHSIDENLYRAFSPNNGDINGDGANDIVVTAGGPYYDASDVVWYENINLEWTKHVIDTDLLGGTWPVVFDVDGDSTMDIIVSAYQSNTVVWYENQHPIWNKKIIDANLKGPRVFKVADLDGDNVNDIIAAANGVVAWYKNPFTTVPFGHSIEVSHIYFPPQGDTLNINAQIINPESHTVTVYAKLLGDKYASSDSIQLFDDGLHGDGDPSDNMWGEKWLKDLKEDIYTVLLSIKDLTTNETYLQPLETRFTTKGPIVFEDYNITSSYTMPNNDERIKISLTLRNDGITDTVYDVDVNLIFPDNPLISNTTTGTPLFGDLAPGESITSSSRDYAITFGDSCSPGSYEFGLEIKSNNEVFWYDSFIFNYEPTDVEDGQSDLPTELTLGQNYPNPFNPTTTIKYSLPRRSEAKTGIPVNSMQSSVGSEPGNSQSVNQPVRRSSTKSNVDGSINKSNDNFVSLKIYDVLGKEVATLVNEQQRPGSYEVKWDAAGLTSGVYFYKLTAGTFSKTKKMILLR